jgi:acetylornithine/succinyldiaminopimelate/putrescine aminotransferase
VPRTRLAETLARLVPGDMQYSTITPSGAEAIDVAIRSARHATGRRKIVSFQGSYHGHGGLSLGAGYVDQARFFLSEHPKDEMVQVPFNDLDALEEAVADGKAAAVLCEMIPATMGFLMPADGYYPEVRRLCDASGTAFIADEVQTGLGRTGRFWACEAYDVSPDILVTGKGLSGGIYPIAAAVHTEAMAKWMKEEGWGYSSTFGGSELGCAVALKVLEIIERPGVLENVSAMSSRLARGLDAIRQRHPFLAEIRQNGLIIGLRFDNGYGGALMAASGYESGLWAFPAGFDPSVLQFKPNLLVDEAGCDEAMQLLENAIELCERRL